MKQLVARAIVLNRTDYGEADRILTLLTPEFGKVNVLAKGVRRVKSKLAGGIELFSVSQVTFIKGRSGLGTLVSSRLEVYYGNIVTDIDRTMKGYDYIKRLNFMTEDVPEAGYFELLCITFAALNDLTIATSVIEVWFGMQALRLSGHEPDLHRDSTGEPLKPNMQYAFDIDTMRFLQAENTGTFSANHIKMLRLSTQATTPHVLAKVQGGTQLCAQLITLIQNLQRHSGLIKL